MMDVNAFRHFYDYHFAMNRFIWDTYIADLSDEQFNQPSSYSLGSIRNHIVHMAQVDEGWFGDLRGVNLSDSLNTQALDDRQGIRDYWDRVEQEMRDYLDTLQDHMLSQKPIPEGEDQDLFLWQILLHVVNHGTDHRAQVLRLLHDVGITTTAQDYIFYIDDQLS